MIRKKTVFILGAGASAEVGMPTGDGLARLISTKLDRRSPKVDEGLFTGLSMLSPNVDRAALLISRGVSGSASIDDFLDVHSADETVKLVGKAAIVRAILECEHGSRLLHTPVRGAAGEVNVASLDDTWFTKLLRLLTAGLRREEAHKLLENVSFITFNYDRCLEVFLLGALSKFYGDHEVAKIIVSSARIHHVYGTVGALPALRPSESEGQIAFGAGGQDRLLHPSIIERIRIYTEKIEDVQQLEWIRSTIDQCEQVFLLGFAYHEQNMRLLGTREKKGATRVFGSMYGMSSASVPFVQGRVRGLLNEQLRSYDSGTAIHLDRNLTCAGMIDEYRDALIS